MKAELIGFGDGYSVDCKAGGGLWGSGITSTWKDGVAGS